MPQGRLSRFGGDPPGAPSSRVGSSLACSASAAGCASGGGGGAFGITVWSTFHPMHTYGTWKFTAPIGTSVTSFSYRVAWQVNGWSSFQSFRGVDPIFDSAHLMDLCQSANGCHTLAAQTRTFGLGNHAGVLLLLEACGPGGDCDGSSNGWVSVSSAAVTLEDSEPPTFSSLGGGLAATSTIRGNASMTLQASDVGTGVYKLHATVDGRSFDDRVVDGNGGKCQAISGPRDFLYATPCRTSASVSTTLNTATLPDGTHALDVKLEDASGNLTTVFHDDITTHNAGASVQRSSKPKIRLRISPRKTSNMHAIHWRGRVVGGRLPKRGATVLAQVKQGRGWIVFRQIRTDDKGRFKFNYRFHATTVATTYAFRVALAHGSVVGQANSKTIKVHVEP